MLQIYKGILCREIVEGSGGSDNVCKNRKNKTLSSMLTVARTKFFNLPVWKSLEVWTGHECLRIVSGAYVRLSASNT